MIHPSYFLRHNIAKFRRVYAVPVLPLFFMILICSCATHKATSPVEGDVNNEVVLRLEPSANNPRNSEGSLIT